MRAAKGKKTTQAETADQALLRSGQVLADPPEDRSTLLAEYFVLSDSYAKMCHQFYKTLSIADTYQQQLKELSQKLEQSDIKLKQLSEVALPICMYCHKIRTDENYWQRLENYFSSHVDIMFSHGICPDCVKTTYNRLGDRNSKSALSGASKAVGGKQPQVVDDEPLKEMRAFLEDVLRNGNPLAPELKKIVDRYAKLLRRFNKILTISDSYQFQLQDLNMRLELMVRTDILTGLANRMEMINQLDVELKRSERHGKKFSLILGDLDHFKQVNDTYGHQAGDRVLRQAAMRLRDSLRAEDLCARWGGEEFMILLPETPLSQAVVVAQKLAESIRSKAIVWEDTQINLTISFGVGEFSAADGSVDEFIHRVDNALYGAKKSGRNRVETAKQAKKG